jgi:hypothetical protein
VEIEIQTGFVVAERVEIQLFVGPDLVTACSGSVRTAFVWNKGETIILVKEVIEKIC